MQEHIFPDNSYISWLFQVFQAIGHSVSLKLLKQRGQQHYPVHCNFMKSGQVQIWPDSWNLTGYEIAGYDIRSYLTTL